MASERGFCEKTWGTFDSKKRKSPIERSEASEGEGAAKMASAASAVGFSSVDPGIPTCTSSSGNQGGRGQGVMTVGL